MDATKVQNQIDGQVVNITQNEDVYTLTMIVRKPKFDVSRLNDAQKATIKSSKEFKEYEEDYFKHMNKIGLGRIKFYYIDS